jgi:Ca-activated chloride channel homolog
MRFESLHYALGFWVIIFMGIYLVFAFRQKQRLIGIFVKNSAVTRLTEGVSFKNQKLKAVLTVLGAAFCILSLMRPQWGFKWQETIKSGIDIFLAVDVSKSMLASDIKPDRLSRSKLAIKDLVTRLKGDRMGLIAFAGTSFVQCPLTTDYNGFILTLDSLDANTIPYGGTSISSAIKAAIDAYKGISVNDKVLVLITDGEGHDANAMDAVRQAKEKGITIFCIGIGTTEGELIPIIDPSGKKTFLKDSQGNVVKTRLNEGMLKDIALATGGSYVRASGTDFGLERIYNDRLAKMQKTDRGTQMSKIYYERFQLPLLIAFFILFSAGIISDRKRP